MKAVLALLLVALLVICAQSKRALPRDGVSVRPRWNPNLRPWGLRKKAVAAIADEEDDEEADFWMALAPLAVNLIKNKLAKKRDDFDEEADFINLKKVWGVAKNIGKQYLASKYGINLDEEEESDSEFLSKLKNWWNSKGKDLAIKGLQIYSQIKNGGAQQGDEADEEEADQNRAFDFGANVNNGNWNVNAGLTGQTRNGGSYNIGGNVGNGGQWGVNGGFSGQTRNGGNYNIGGNVGAGGQWGVNGGYDRTWNGGRTSFGATGGYGSGGFNAGVKFSHRFDDIEEADFINWKKVWGVAKDIGKTYLSSKYGINLDEEEESDSEFIKINWKKIGNIAKDIGKTYLSSKYGINLDEADEEESDSADAYSQVAAAGIPISSSGRCNNRNVRSCTSLDGIRSNTLNGIITLKRASGCPITITGGTEVGHAGGQYSHSNGYKLDIALNSCIDGYITRNFANIGRRGDGAQQYRASSGNVYAREGNHWDITYY